MIGDDVVVTIDESETRQRRKVKHFVQHPNYCFAETVENDVGVIRVRISII